METYEKNLLGQQEWGWNHPAFYTIKNIIKEEQLFVHQSVPVDEGIEPCPRCKSTKTYSYQEQRRSADEPMTTFVICFNSKCKRINVLD